MEFALLLTLPAAAALMTIAEPVIRVLFQRGSFGPAETQATAAALVAFAAGLPAYVLIKVIVPGFFAREDTRTPVKVAGAAVVVNIALNLALVGPLAHVGMALATALAAWFNAAALAWILRKRGFFALDRRLKSRAPRILLAAVVMAAVLAVAEHFSRPFATSSLTALLVVIGLVSAGLASFALAAQLLGAARLAEIRKMMRRQRP
jgi:putative peptidoglycan lipid II flippase